MQKTKLITLLNTFSKQEMKDFEKLISSPYFSKGRNLKPLFNVLKKYYPKFENRNLDQEKIFQKLNPGKEYEKKKSGRILKVLVSELTTLLEKFLAFEEIQKECGGYYMYKFLSHAFFDKKLFGFSQKVILKNTKRIQKSQSDSQFFAEMVAMNDELGELLITMDNQKENPVNDQKTLLYLYGYMTCRLLYLVNNYATNVQLSYHPNPVSIRLLEMGVNSFDPEIFENECYDDGLGTKQMILTTYFVIKCQLNSGGEENLKTAIEIYKRNFQNFRRSVKWGFFATILNICSIRLSVFGKVYSTLGSDLIDFAVDNGLIDQHEGFPMSPPAFLSFLHLKLHVLKHENLKTFIDTTLEKIDPEHRKLLLEYSYAWLSFKNNNYEKTLEYLSRFTHHETAVKDIAAQLRIASLYSLGYIEETIYNLDSYEHHIHKKAKLTKRTRNQVPLFINYLRTFIKLRLNSEMVGNNVINKIIEDSKNSYFHFWYKTEAEKLKK